MDRRGISIEHRYMVVRNACMAVAFFSPVFLGVWAVATPPGNVWEPVHYVAVILVIAGAFLGGHPRRSGVVYLAYGWTASLWFLPLLMPDRRDYIAIGLGTDSIRAYEVRSCVFIAVVGFACWAAGTTRGLFDRALAPTPDLTRCRRCGYLLLGLPERRCPECGERFEHEVPSRLEE